MPVIRLNISDDEEFTKCHCCKAMVKAYNNTSLSTTPHIDNVYTQTLLKYHHLNCEKCGLYIEMHPTNPKEEGLIFLCPSSIPHRHCLCYDCGLLYDLEANTKKIDILNQLQFNNPTQPSSAEIGPDSSNNVLSATANNTGYDAGGINTALSNATFLGTTDSVDNNNVDDHEMDGSSVGSESGQNSMSDRHELTLFIGTIMALLLWLTVYLSSPELFRLSGCFVWLSTFYYLTNLYFNDNEAVQRAVFSLFGFSPILTSIYVFEKTRRLNQNQISKDIKRCIQFFCVFGCIAYFSYYWTPMDMYLFLVHDFIALSLQQKIISLFIAWSIGAFIIMLLKNCKILSTVFYHEQQIMNKFINLNHVDGVDEVDEQMIPSELKEIEQMKQMKPINSSHTEIKRKRRRRKRKKKRIE